MVNNLPAMQEIWIRSLGWEDPLEKETATHFRILPWRIPWTGLEEAQAGIKIAGRNINNVRYADDTTLMAESKEELKNLLMKVKEESEALA